MGFCFAIWEKTYNFVVNSIKETINDSDMNDDEKYMWRCLQLARCGLHGARPNPMVGAVIVARGRIIGEGYHRQCGKGHAEVNAFASVRAEDEPLLKESTIYVSLEPCAHWGKTPPCADLIVRKQVRRCVVGCVDSFAKVSGRGIQRIREAGIEVTVGVLERECRQTNRLFFTYHSQHRPFITLKWAQTADGFIDDHGKAVAISSPLTAIMMHRLRSEADAIAVGRVTEEREHPRLSNRLWGGSSPQKVVISGSLPDAYHSIDSMIDGLYAKGVQHVVVEGGLTTLERFLHSGQFDQIRVEYAPFCVGDGTRAPMLPNGLETIDTTECDGRKIMVYEKKDYTRTDKQIALTERE